MFIEINSLEIVEVGDKQRQIYVYEIIDSTFLEKVSISGITRETQSVAPEVVVLNKYLEKGLPIAPNMARLYLFYKEIYGMDISSTMGRYKNLIDQHFPELNYGKLYYPCILRQIKQISFGRAK